MVSNGFRELPKFAIKKQETGEAPMSKPSQKFTNNVIDMGKIVKLLDGNSWEPDSGGVRRSDFITDMKIVPILMYAFQMIRGPTEKMYYPDLQPRAGTATKVTVSSDDKNIEEDQLGDLFKGLSTRVEALEETIEKLLDPEELEVYIKKRNAAMVPSEESKPHAKTQTKPRVKPLSLDEEVVNYFKKETTADSDSDSSKDHSEGAHGSDDDDNGSNGKGTEEEEDEEMMQEDEEDIMHEDGPQKKRRRVDTTPSKTTPNKRTTRSTTGPTPVEPKESNSNDEGAKEEHDSSEDEKTKGKNDTKQKTLNKQTEEPNSDDEKPKGREKNKEREMTKETEKTKEMEKESNKKKMKQKKTKAQPKEFRVRIFKHHVQGGFSSKSVVKQINPYLYL